MNTAIDGGDHTDDNLQLQQQQQQQQQEEDDDVVADCCCGTISSSSLSTTTTSRPTSRPKSPQQLLLSPSSLSFDFWEQQQQHVITNHRDTTSSSSSTTGSNGTRSDDTTEQQQQQQEEDYWKWIVRMALQQSPPPPPPTATTTTTTIPATIEAHRSVVSYTQQKEEDEEEDEISGLGNTNDGPLTNAPVDSPLDGCYAGNNTDTDTMILSMSMMTVVPFLSLPITMMTVIRPLDGVLSYTQQQQQQQQDEELLQGEPLHNNNNKRRQCFTEGNNTEPNTRSTNNEDGEDDDNTVWEIPSHVVFRTNNVVQMTAMTNHSRMISTIPSEIYCCSTTTTTATTTTKLMMIQPPPSSTEEDEKKEETDDNGCSRSDGEDNDDDDLLLWILATDAIEIYTYDPILKQLQNQYQQSPQSQPLYNNNDNAATTTSMFLQSVQDMDAVLNEYCHHIHHWANINPNNKNSCRNNDVSSTSTRTADATNHTDMHIQQLQTKLLQSIQQYPILCQIQFIVPLPYCTQRWLCPDHRNRTTQRVTDGIHEWNDISKFNSDDATTINTNNNNNTIKTMKCNLFTFFVMVQWYDGIQVAYDAYPEAIGQYVDMPEWAIVPMMSGGGGGDGGGGGGGGGGGYLPLHYACLYYSYDDNDCESDRPTTSTSAATSTTIASNNNDNCNKIIQFLLQCYPDAVRTKSIHAKTKTAVAPSPCNDNKKDGTDVQCRISVPAADSNRQRQQLPIHILCQHCNGRMNPIDLIELLIHYYPTSIHQHDSYGYTPFMYLCANSYITNIVDVVEALLLLESPQPLSVSTTTTTASIDITEVNLDRTIGICNNGNNRFHCPLTMLRSVSNTDEMEYILHLACTYHIDNPKLIQLFIRHDPISCQYTNMKFQLPIHTAVTSYCQYVMNTGNQQQRRHEQQLPVDDTKMNCMIETIQLLVDAYPASVDWCDDDHDETPDMIMKRLLIATESDNIDCNCSNMYHAYHQRVHELLTLNSP